VDQVDHGDHDPPWWTRSVQDPRGPRFDISLMQSHIREQALARMLHSSTMAIFSLLLGRSPPLLSNSSVVGSEWLGIMAGVASEFRTPGKWEGTRDGK